MLPTQSPLEELVTSCNDPLLAEILEAYAQQKYDSKEQVVSHLTDLFAAVLEARLDAEQHDS